MKEGNVYSILLIIALLLVAWGLNFRDCDTKIEYYHNGELIPTIPMNDTDFRLGCLNLCVKEVQYNSNEFSKCVDYCRGGE